MTWLQANAGLVLALLAPGYVVLLALGIFLWRQQRVSRRSGSADDNGRAAAGDFSASGAAVGGGGAALSETHARVLARCLQVGLVRYDAFPDMGGGQSFSIALLNEAGDGLVLSGLYSRHDLRVYAKPVEKNVSPEGQTAPPRSGSKNHKLGWARPRQ